MTIQSHSQLRDAVTYYLDRIGVFHRFDDCYSFDSISSVMLFSVYLPDKFKQPLLSAIPHFNILSSLNILKSKIPNQYYIELIYPNL